MKKILALLLTTVLIASLVACGSVDSIPKNNNVDPAASDSSGEVQSNQNNDQNNESADSNTVDSYATQNINGFMTLMKSVLNLSDYEEKSAFNGTTIKLNNTNNNSAKPDLSMTIDGYSFSLPVKYTDVIAAGWTDNQNLAEEELDKKSITTTTFTTSAGKEIKLSFVNQSDSPMKIKDTEAVKLETYTLCVGANEGKTVNPPSFTIFGGIDNDTDLEGIIETAGAPSYIDVQDNDGHVYNTITYRDGDDSFEIKYFGDVNKIREFTAKSGIAGAVITY